MTTHKEINPVNDHKEIKTQYIHENGGNNSVNIVMLPKVSCHFKYRTYQNCSKYDTERMTQE